MSSDCQKVDHNYKGEHAAALLYECRPSGKHVLPAPGGFAFPHSYILPAVHITHIFAGIMYQFVRSILFLFDPEKVHYLSMNALKGLCRIGILRKLLSLLFEPGKTVPIQPIPGVQFKNPVGLAAGFDKNARWLREIEVLGFGCVEIGTVTPLSQDGNSKPRLFRLPKDKALINRMGFNNDGLNIVSQRLARWRNGEGRLSTLIIGGNIGKNKATSNEEAWRDYEKCFLGLVNYVDYFVVNVSSPNTPGLRELQEKESLRKILVHLQQLSEDRGSKKPILLKIAPDLNLQQVDDVIGLALEINLEGLVVANTTICREALKTTAAAIETVGAGGLSGKPLRERSTSMLRYIAGKTKGEIPLIASGGVFNAGDAREKLAAGASLVQVWTGFVYEGPSIVKNICKGLIS